MSEINTTFNSVEWVIEGDIKACFDSFDHHVLIGILRQRIKDEHFIALMWKMLKARYIWNSGPIIIPTLALRKAQA